MPIRSIRGCVGGSTSVDQQAGIAELVRLDLQKRCRDRPAQQRDLDVRQKSREHRAQQPGAPDHRSRARRPGPRELALDHLQKRSHGKHLGTRPVRRGPPCGLPDGATIIGESASPKFGIAFHQCRRSGDMSRPSSFSSAPPRCRRPIPSASCRRPPRSRDRRPQPRWRPMPRRAASSSLIADLAGVLAAWSRTRPNARRRYR